MEHYVGKFYSSNNKKHHHKFSSEERHEAVGYYAKLLAEYEDCSKCRVYADGELIFNMSQGHPSSGAVNISFKELNG